MYWRFLSLVTGINVRANASINYVLEIPEPGHRHQGPRQRFNKCCTSDSRAGHTRLFPRQRVNKFCTADSRAGHTRQLPFQRANDAKAKRVCVKG